MPHIVPPTGPVDALHHDGKHYRCGTLTYTKMGLFVLFGWILWGDFCFILMESVWPTIIQAKLEHLTGNPKNPSYLIDNANLIKTLVISVTANILNMTICPWVSFRSDRYRSRWGRRIPFIAATIPFLCLSLILMGFGEGVSAWIQHHVPLLHRTAPATVTLILLAIFFTLFQFFNMFVNSVFWYLFNDVVPRQFLARFLGLFRVVGTVAGMLYNYFVKRYSDSHGLEILLGAAVIYFVGMGLMCWRVKEGEYPPMEEAPEDKHEQDPAEPFCIRIPLRIYQGIKTFVKESFAHRFYRAIFLSTGMTACASVWMGSLILDYYNEMDLPLDATATTKALDLGMWNLGLFSFHFTIPYIQGTMDALGGMAALLATYFVSIYVDRWHPLRVTFYLAIFGVIATLMNWVWVFVVLPGQFFFWLTLGSAIIATFQGQLGAAAALPKEMRLFPTSRFGQFCSAQATFRSLCAMIAAPICGLFIDYIGNHFYPSHKSFALRYLFVWTSFFTIASSVAVVLYYRYWLEHGGDKHFHPPAPWSPSGVEEQPIVPCIGPQTRWLKIAFGTFDILLAVSTLGILPMMWWMQQKHAFLAYRWFGICLLPIAAFTWLWWVGLKRGILRDMQAARDSRPLRNGIPHHGMLLVVGTKFLLALILWVIQIHVTIGQNMEAGAIVFGVANLMTNLMLVAGVQFVCRIERGYSTTIDEVPAAMNDDPHAAAST